MSLDTDVLVVGAGPVGLALAADLGWRGHSCLVVEQGDGSIWQPKMDMVGVRTMEFCRRWGIVGNVEASPYPRDYAQDNVYVTSLVGYELGREPFPSMDREKPGSASPQKRERCPQNMFDPILRDFAHSFPGIGFRYKHRLETFEIKEDRVVATISDGTGARRDVSARFIVGCDGAKSSVRDILGIGMVGQQVLTYTTNAIFRCDDLDSLHDKGPAYRYIVLGTEGTWATLVAINGRDQWRLSIVGGSEPRLYSEAEVADVIRRVVGRDFDFEILTIVPWARGELVAEHYGRGRAFIAGDACHVMSPTGGFGMNTGIADAVDLSWKISAVLEGWGGPALLDSYDAERRPVGVRNASTASANLRRMMAPRPNAELLDDTPAGAAARVRVGEEFSRAMRHEWFTAHIHLGFCYAGSPVIADENEAPWNEPPRDELVKYVQSGRAGCRAPHVWLQDGRSTLDLFGKGFVLVVTDPLVEAETMERAARALQVPFQVYRDDSPDLRAAYDKALVVVRPDGHVAWRGDRPPADPSALMRRVTGIRS